MVDEGEGGGGVRGVLHCGFKGADAVVGAVDDVGDEGVVGDGEMVRHEDL